MRKRKFMSVFAILFVAIFALSVCFFAACKGKKDEEDPTPETEVEDENDDNDDGTESGTGRSGSPLTGDEDIIGIWSDYVEVEANAFGIGGTIESIMTVEITADNFKLAFTPNEIIIDDIVDEYGYGDLVTSVLEGAGIMEGVEFVMFDNFPVLVDENGYYADIDGDWITCQLPLEINEDGKLHILFQEPLDFSGIPVNIVFDAVLESGEFVVIDREDYVIDVATSDDSQYLKVTLENGRTVTFENDENDIDITTRNGIDYTVKGTSSEMTANMATWFGGSAKEGDQYVVIKVKVASGETISYSSEDGTVEKSYTNTGAEDDPNFDDGYLFIVYRLDFDDNGVCASRGEYTITDENGVETVYTVSFSGVTVLTRTVTISVGDKIVTSVTMEVGEVKKFVGNAVLSDGGTQSSYLSSKWGPSDSTVVSVNQGGLGSYYTADVTALSAGVEEVTFTLSTGEVGRCTVTVVDPLVSFYEGEGVTLGDGTTDTTFANGSPLTVTMTQDTSGVYNDYTVSGAANVMSEEQIAAYNAAYSDNQATEGDAYIVLEIKADAGSTVSYSGQTYTVGEDETSVTIVQKINASGTTDAINVTITSGSETTASFTIDFSDVAIPDMKLVGTWSSGEIEAKVSINIVVTMEVEATASVELTVYEDGTYKLEISNIHTNYDSIVNLEGQVITMEGTWAGGNGTYTLTGEGGNSVAVVMNEDGESVQMSFSITYTLESLGMDIPITVTDETLTSGPLETTTEGGED